MIEPVGHKSGRFAVPHKIQGVSKKIQGLFKEKTVSAQILLFKDYKSRFQGLFKARANHVQIWILFSRGEINIFKLKCNILYFSNQEIKAVVQQSWCSYLFDRYKSLRNGASCARTNSNAAENRKVLYRRKRLLRRLRICPRLYSQRRGSWWARRAARCSWPSWAEAGPWTWTPASWACAGPGPRRSAARCACSPPSWCIARSAPGRCGLRDSPASASSPSAGEHSLLVCTQAKVSSTRAGFHLEKFSLTSFICSCGREKKLANSSLASLLVEKLACYNRLEKCCDTSKNVGTSR